MQERPLIEIPRRRLSKAEHLAMFIAQEGRCNCGDCGGLKLLPGEIHEQHDPPHELRKNDPGYDGKPSKLFTRECHENITRTQDGPAIVKARHMGGGKGSQVARRQNKSHRPIKSRGFPTKEERARIKERLRNE